MSIRHIVRKGECLSSIAHEYGLSWQAVWNHPDNGELKSKRKDPNIVMVGDALTIPEKKIESIGVSTDAKHRFRAKGVPIVLRLQLLNEQGEPRRSIPYVLDLDGNSVSGTTDDEGRIEERVSPSVRTAELEITDGQESQTFDLLLGGLDPVDEDSGLIQRLTNLGYACADETVLGEITKQALKAFQEAHGLEPSGTADAQTREKLEAVHGS